MDCNAPVCSYWFLMLLKLKLSACSINPRVPFLSPLDWNILVSCKNTYSTDCLGLTVTMFLFSFCLSVFKCVVYSFCPCTNISSSLLLDAAGISHLSCNTVNCQ